MKTILGLGAFIVLGLVASITGMGATPNVFRSGVVPVHGVRLTTSQELGATYVSSCLNYDLNVIRAWFLAEGGAVSQGQPAYNYLFIGGAGGPSFKSPEEGAAAICKLLQGSGYAGVLAAAGQASILQLIAIAESPWDGGYVPWGDARGHYGGTGANLLSVYYSLMGSSLCLRSSPC